jgi:hypothetical protein
MVSGPVAGSGLESARLWRFADAVAQGAAVCGWCQLASSVPLSVDPVSFQKNGSEEMMEILASRRKPDGDPPRVVRYRESYYRLEGCAICAGPRPFRYTLRRLSAGVPGRTVLLYEPEGPVITGER